MDFLSKYDTLKVLRETKARDVHICARCGAIIKPGELYYRESIGKVSAPGLTLKKFCALCYLEHRAEIGIHE